MTYEEMEKMKKGDRVHVLVNGQYRKATITEIKDNQDAYVWCEFDYLPGTQIKLYTGMQFQRDYFNKSPEHLSRFTKFTDIEEENEMEFIFQKWSESND